MFAINFATIVPIRASHADESEIMTQMLFGDTFEILETHHQWKYIRTAYDNYEGWIDEKVVLEISQEEFYEINREQQYYTSDVLCEVVFPKSGKFMLPMGSLLPHFNPTNRSLRLGDETGELKGNFITGKHDKMEVLKIALSYLNAPYLWGGKTHFGLDCSGLTQMAYKMCGYNLSRNASQQALQGENIDLKDAEAGDLAFFSNAKGKIIHVGFLIGNGQIYHSHGNAHIDPIDEKGIWSNKFQRYSHQLSHVKSLS